MSPDKKANVIASNPKITASNKVHIYCINYHLRHGCSDVCALCPTNRIRDALLTDTHAVWYVPCTICTNANPTLYDRAGPDSAEDWTEEYCISDIRGDSRAQLPHVLRD